MTRPGILLVLLTTAFFCSPRATGQELVVYSMPAPVRYNWKSPHTLIISYLENLLKPNRYRGHKHPMGHMLIELRDSTRHIMAGAVPQSIAQLRKSVLSDKHGLGTLFMRYNGVLESTDENLHQLIDRYPHGDIAYIRFLVSPKTFGRLWQYLNEYKERGYDTIYNGNNSPREGAGAGCSAFAVSFIEVGNLLDSATLSQWQVKLNIQDKLIGGPGNERKIGILKMMFSQHWAKTGKDKYQSLVYYEPTLVYNWIEAMHFETNCNTLCETELREMAPGIVIDRRNHPTPDEPIWYEQ